MDKGVRLALATALISGFSIFLNSYAIKGFESSVFTFSKNVLVAVFLASLILAAGKLSSLKDLKRKDWAILALIGLVGGSIPFLLFFKGLQLTGGPLGGFIHKTLFVFVALFALLFIKEKLKFGALLGAGLLLAGTYLLFRPDLAFGSGHLLVLAATMLWAVENVISKTLAARLEGTVIAFGRMFFGSIFIFIYLAFVGKAELVWQMSGAQYLWIGVTSLLLLGYVWTFYNSLNRIDVSLAACIVALGSPITALLDFAFRGVAIDAFQVSGVILMAAGVACVAWSKDMFASREVA